MNHNYIFVVDAEITGNDKTKEKIILRELDFAIGDSLATFDLSLKNNTIVQKRISLSDSSEVSRRLKYSRENIINSSIFFIPSFNHFFALTSPTPVISINEFLFSSVLQTRPPSQGGFLLTTGLPSYAMVRFFSTPFF